MRVLGIITARGGSKGIPGKNLKLLGGRPLLDYTIDAANDTPLDRLILSTEDQKIADAGAIARLRGAVHAPGGAGARRNAAPAGDPARRAVDARARGLPAGRRAHPAADLAAAIRRPTSPRRCACSNCPAPIPSSASARCRRTRTRCACCASTTAAIAVLFATGEPVRTRINRRQDLPEAWVMNGAIYACRTDVLFAARAEPVRRSRRRLPDAGGALDLASTHLKTGPRRNGPWHDSRTTITTITMNNLRPFGPLRASRNSESHGR